MGWDWRVQNGIDVVNDRLLAGTGRRGGISPPDPFAFTRNNKTDVQRSNILVFIVPDRVNSSLARERERERPHAVTHWGLFDVNLLPPPRGGAKMARDWGASFLCLSCR